MKYLIALILGIGLVVLTFVLIFKAFSGNNNQATKPQQIDLNSYATTNAVMRYTIDGPINADQNHRRIRVTVGNDQVLLEILKGYQGSVVTSKTYPSNAEAYTDFLHSLTLASFNKGRDQAPKDERGYCPAGRRYIYEAMSSGDNIMRWWSDSCASADGNFAGSAGTVRLLFTSQVPDFYKQTAGVAY